MSSLPGLLTSFLLFGLPAAAHFPSAPDPACNHAQAVHHVSGPGAAVVATGIGGAPFVGAALVRDRGVACATQALCKPGETL